jgi:hypothetical protein
MLKITRIGDVMRSNTELIDMSDALIQREIYPLYIMLKEQPLPWRNGASDRSRRRSPRSKLGAPAGPRPTTHTA